MTLCYRTQLFCYSTTSSPATRTALLQLKIFLLLVKGQQSWQTVVSSIPLSPHSLLVGVALNLLSDASHSGAALLLLGQDGHHGLSKEVRVFSMAHHLLWKHKPHQSARKHPSLSVITLLWEQRGGEKNKQQNCKGKKKKNKMQTAKQQSQNPSSQKSTDTIQEGMAELRTSFLKCQNWGENVFYLCSVLSLKYLNTKRGSKPAENHCAVSQHWACAGLIQMATSTPMWRTELF